MRLWVSIQDPSIFPLSTFLMLAKLRFTLHFCLSLFHVSYSLRDSSKYSSLASCAMCLLPLCLIYLTNQIYLLSSKEMYPKLTTSEWINWSLGTEYSQNYLPLYLILYRRTSTYGTDLWHWNIFHKKEALLKRHRVEIHRKTSWSYFWDRHSICSHYP